MALKPLIRLGDSWPFRGCEGSSSESEVRLSTASKIAREEAVGWEDLLKGRLVGRRNSGYGELGCEDFESDSSWLDEAAFRNRGCIKEGATARPN